MSHDIENHDLIFSKDYLQRFKERNNIKSCALTGGGASLCTKEVQAEKSGIRSLVKYYFQMMSLSLMSHAILRFATETKIYTARNNGDKSGKVRMTDLYAATQVVLKYGALDHRKV